MGQNFLIEGWVPEDIAASAGLTMQSTVLEIGPGIGCLTVELAKRAQKVVAIELDRALLPILAETLGNIPNVQIVQGDILKLDLQTLYDTHFKDTRPLVCSNLPYNITTPVLTKLIDAGLFEQITLMIQREVAQRLCAPAANKNYGAISLYIAYHTEPTLLFDVPPECFMPAPNVTSSVITLKKRKAPPVNTDPKALFQLIKIAFSKRRKTLLNCLSADLPHASKDELAQIVISCGHDPRIRGETLDLEAFSKLADALLAEGLLKV